MTAAKTSAPVIVARCQGRRENSNCSDLRGSADYSAYCGGATEHGISTANRFRPLKREQLQKTCHWGGVKLYHLGVDVQRKSPN